MNAEPIILFEGGPAPNRVLDDCAAAGLQLCPYIECLEVPGRPILMGRADHIPLAFSGNFSGFIEYVPDIDGTTIPPSLVSVVSAGGYCMAATTATMMSNDPCARFAALILQGFPRLAPQAMMMELALAEASTNALVHGNLDLHSELRQTLEGLSEFNRRIKERTADTAYSLRRIVITAEPVFDGGAIISVTDEGKGFDIAAELSKPVNPTAKSGRGLALIRKAACALSGADGGRTLRMKFSPDL